MKQTKKPRKSDSFSLALKAAEKRLNEATAERGVIQDKLCALNNEIPNLQRTIAALKQQINTGPVKATTAPAELSATDPRRLAPPEDLTGMGSILPAHDGPTPQSEDSLPPIDGKPILE